MTDAITREAGDLPQRKTAGAGSSRKVLQILFAFTERRTSASVAELAELLDAPVPTVYRHVALLKELQLLEEGPPGSYHPTARVMPLARAAQLSNSLAVTARPIIGETSEEFRETVMLMQHVGDAVVCVELAECDRPMRFTFQRGHSIPLGVGASGKMALASLTPTLRASWLRRIEASEPLEEEIQRAAREGFATSQSELDEGVWACSVPALTGGRRTAVLTVAGPAVRFTEEQRVRAVSVLEHSARRIRQAVSRFSLDLE